MSRALLAALLLAVAACRKPSKTQAPPPAGFTRYERVEPGLSLLAPESWRVLENQGGAQIASFLGPSGGKRPYSQSLGLYFHGAGGVYGSIEEYASAQERAGTRKTSKTLREWKGRRILELTTLRQTQRRLHSSDRETRRERMALIPTASGFFLLVASAPEAETQASDAVFERALGSLELPR